MYVSSLVARTPHSSVQSISRILKYNLLDYYVKGYYVKGYYVKVTTRHSEL